MTLEGASLPVLAEEVLGFWFGPVLDSTAVIPGDRLGLWFGGKAETDQQIRERYAPTLERALQSDSLAWLGTPRGRLALIVVLDQFSRNIFRNTTKAFAADSLALALALSGMSMGDDLELSPVGRAFFYLPLEHSEKLENQEMSVAAFDRLRQVAPPAQKETFVGFYDYAVRHREVIARFGRFPHRNRILGRESSAAELVFLQQPGSSF